MTRVRASTRLHRAGPRRSRAQPCRRRPRSRAPATGRPRPAHAARRDAWSSRFVAELPGEERQRVRLLIGTLGDRLPDAVARTALLMEQHRAFVLADGGGLELGGHLA